MTFQRVLAIVLLVLIQSSVSGSRPYHAYQIPEGIPAPVPDGILSDPIWSLAGPDTCLFGDSGNWNTPWTWFDNNLVTWRAVWSAGTNQLFVAVEVRDDIRGTFDNNDPKNKNFLPWNDDSIEFYTDGNLSRGDYLGRFDIAQQWRVTGENHRILGNYPVYNAVDFYSGDAFVTAVAPGTNGNWICEAVFEIYDNFPNARKTIAAGDSIGWEIRYSDSDDKTWRDNAFIADYFVGWVYSGPAVSNADYFGKLIFEPAVVQHSISITRPDESTHWYLGETGSISWTTTGTIAAVTLEISYNNGVSWSILADSIENHGEFQWPIAGETSGSCRIKISDSNNADLFSTSALFKIEEKPALQITAPKTGEHWYVGYRNKITWTSQGAIDSVALALSRDNGQTWTVLATLFNVTRQFYWTVSGPISNQCQIQISDPKHPEVMARSQNFSIEVEPLLQITQPQPNEIWFIGLKNRIEWSFQGQIDSVKIELTRNHGLNWEELGKSVSTDSVFDWLVTGPSSADCQIKISATQDPLLFSRSASFQIAEIPRLQITAPGVSATWYVGSSYPISWVSQGAVDSVLVKLTRDSGATWEVLGGAPNSAGRFNWQVTGTASANCKICIEDLHDSEVSDTTEFTLMIAVPQIQVSQPATILYGYSEVQFIWQSFGPVELVNIELSRNGGQTWETLAARISNAGYFTWQISGVPSNRCLLRISNADHPATLGLSTLFTIKNPVLTLQTPVGGEIWEIDSHQQIRWGTEGVISQVKIELKRDDEGNFWEQLTAAVTNTGSFGWEVAGAVSAQCKIRISDAQHPEINTSSANFFAIAEIPFIQIQKPIGNENWQIDSVQPIQWRSNSRIESVVIKLSRNNQASWSTLARDVANSGSFDWTVTGPEAKLRCFIQILSSHDTTLSSANQWPFSIESAPILPELTLTAPAAQSAFEIGTTLSIQWQVTGAISFIKIELSRNGGKSWQELATVNAQNLSFNWQTSSPITRQCLVRISDPASSAVAISDTLELLPQFIQELANPNSQPSGSSQNGYRLISIPLEIRQPGADSVLLDDLGEYNPENWRLFDLKDGEYREFPDVGQLSPGKSMFLIVREPYQVIDAGAGNAVMNEIFVIPLVSGWNLVANPYETRVAGSLSVDHLVLHSQEPITLYSYEGAWGISRDFKPWTGYALKTRTADTLKIHPNWVFGYAKSRPELKHDGWRIQITATCQHAVDSLNFLGTASDASLARDDYDQYEPPPIGEFVRLYFPHLDWANAPDDYTLDFQKPEPDGNVWEFVVTTNILNAEVTLEFEGLSAIGDGQQVVLLDQGMRTQNPLLQNRNSISFHLRQDQKYYFKLIVGSQELVNRETRAYTTPPGSFQVFPNFPNPFNSQTAIRFYLSEDCEIEAEIYNLLGARVATIIPKKPSEAGFFQINWEAKNADGQNLASGIYLLRFKANPGKVFFQKMVLVK
jgi:hypothetical protein